MTRLLGASAALTVLLGTSAMATPIDATTWTGAQNVSRSGSAGPSSTFGSTVVFTGNANRTAVSPTALTAPFVFSGTVLPASNDDDVIGLTFGYVDGANNYRIGWEGGGLNDGETNSNGMWVVEESGGVATTLFATDLYWSGGTTYNFTLTVIGSSITFAFLEGTTVIGGTTVTGTRSTEGKIGVYANSQGATFSNLDLAEPPAVPLPASLPLMLAGLGGLVALRRKRG